MLSLCLDTIDRYARESGLQLAGITDLSPNWGAGKRLVQWQSAGFAAELGYMLRNPALLSDAGYLSKSAKTLLSFTIRYEAAAHPERPAGYGRVARYAWGRDYHGILKKRLADFLSRLKQEHGSEVRARFFTDAVPLMERAFAARAGSGFVGRNTMLIRPGVGSNFFLAEMLVNFEIANKRESSLKHVKGSCGSCSKCLPSCPTGALAQEYSLDARRCISYLTIEKRGALNLQERAWLGEWLFGCDICQDVCPFNHKGLKTSPPPEIEDFQSSSGAGSLLNLGDLFLIKDHDQYVKRFAGTPLMRAKREGLLRNAAVVAANTEATGLCRVLGELAISDGSAIIRQHAMWAACQLYSIAGDHARSKRLAEKHTTDSAAEVAKEAAQILELQQS